MFYILSVGVCFSQVFGESWIKCWRRLKNLTYLPFKCFSYECQSFYLWSFLPHCESVVALLLSRAICPIHTVVLAWGQQPEVKDSFFTSKDLRWAGNWNAFYLDKRCWSKTDFSGLLMGIVASDIQSSILKRSKKILTISSLPFFPLWKKKVRQGYNLWTVSHISSMDSAGIEHLPFLPCF